MVYLPARLGDGEGESFFSQTRRDEFEDPNFKRNIFCGSSTGSFDPGRKRGCFAYGLLTATGRDGRMKSSSIKLVWSRVQRGFGEGTRVREPGARRRK